MKYGTLHGVGVGPGDPELITMKAVRVLESADVIFAARSTKNTHSTSLNIIKPHLGEKAVIECLPFPMTRDKQKLEKAWEENARRVLTVLSRPGDAAFVTLGDPMTYSTFNYLMRTVKRFAPEAGIEVVPGVTAYQAAAAAALIPLAEQEETICVVSGANGGEKIRQAAKAADTMVVLKAYKKFDQIKTALRENDLDLNAALISNCGLPGEIICHGLAESGEKPGYFSLVIAKKKGRSDPPEL